MVTPPALVEAKAPVGRHVRTTYDLLILLDHCLRLRTKEEVKIENTYKNEGDQGESWFILHECGKAGRGGGCRGMHVYPLSD